MRTLPICVSILVSGWLVSAVLAHDPFLGLPFKTTTAVPSSGDASSPAAAFDLTNEGNGGVAAFTSSNQTAANEAAVRIRTDGSNAALDVATTGRGIGAVFSTENSSGREHTVEITTDAAAAALRVATRGFGTGVEAVSSGSGPAANLRIDNPASQAAVLEVSTNGSGPAALFEGDVQVNGQLLRAVPVGVILPFFGDVTSLPDGWLLCDGQTVSDAKSPLNGTPTPDLRGMFLRGADGGSPIKTSGGRDTISDHGHSFSDSDSIWIPMNSGNGYTNAYHPVTQASAFDRSLRNLTAPDNASNPYNTHGHMGGTVSIFGTTRPGGGHDNRPRFYSVNYIIRIK